MNTQKSYQHLFDFTPVRYSFCNDMVVYYQVHTAAHSYLIVSTGDLKAINEFRYIPYHTDKTIELDDELIALEEDELHHT